MAGYLVFEIWYPVDLRSGTALIILQRISHSKCCLDGSTVQPELSKEVELAPNVKLQCVTKFFCMGDTLGTGSGVEEAPKAIKHISIAWVIISIYIYIYIYTASYKHCKPWVYDNSRCN